MSRTLGYIDPAIVPRGPSDQQMLARIRKRGLSLHKVGESVRLTGPGVFVLAAGLGSIHTTDLAPPSNSEIAALAYRLRGN